MLRLLLHSSDHHNEVLGVHVVLSTTQIVNPESLMTYCIYTFILPETNNSISLSLMRSAQHTWVCVCVREFSSLSLSLSPTTKHQTQTTNKQTTTYWRSSVKKRSFFYVSFPFSKGIDFLDLEPYRNLKTRNSSMTNWLSYPIRDPC